MVLVVFTLLMPFTFVMASVMLVDDHYGTAWVIPVRFSGAPEHRQEQQ
jgi:hypothetical protein